MLISIGFSWGNDNYRDYFGPDYIKRFVKELLDLKCKHNMKLNKPLLFTTEDKKYHNAYSKSHICDTESINEVRGLLS